MNQSYTVLYANISDESYIIYTIYHIYYNWSPSSARPASVRSVHQGAQSPCDTLGPGPLYRRWGSANPHRIAWDHQSWTRWTAWSCNSAPSSNMDWSATANQTKKHWSGYASQVARLKDSTLSSPVTAVKIGTAIWTGCLLNLDKFCVFCTTLINSTLLHCWCWDSDYNSSLLVAASSCYISFELQARLEDSHIHIRTLSCLWVYIGVPSDQRHPSSAPAPWGDATKLLHASSSLQKKWSCLRRGQAHRPCQQ